MVQGSLNGVSRKFQEFFPGISGKCQWCFKKVSNVFQVRLKGISSSFNANHAGGWANGPQQI